MKFTATGRADAHDVNAYLGTVVFSLPDTAEQIVFGWSAANIHSGDFPVDYKLRFTRDDQELYVVQIRRYLEFIDALPLAEGVLVSLLLNGADTALQKTHELGEASETIFEIEIEEFFPQGDLKSFWELLHPICT